MTLDEERTPDAATDALDEGGDPVCWLVLQRHFVIETGVA